MVPLAELEASTSPGFKCAAVLLSIQPVAVSAYWLTSTDSQLQVDELSLQDWAAEFKDNQYAKRVIEG